MPDIPVTLALPAWLAVVVAPFVGSLLGVLIRRLPAGQPVLLTRSACEGCGRSLRPGELVPILSYLWWRGRCRCGAAEIGRFHLAVELAAMAVPASALLAGQSGAWLWTGCLLGWGLLALAWIDAGTCILPDALTLPLTPLGLAVTWWLAPLALAAHAAAAALGWACFTLLRHGWRHWRGVDGLGAGDAKLLGVAGAWLGAAALPDVILAAGVCGLALATGLRLAGWRIEAETRLPFGPALALAIWGAWLLHAGGPS